MGTRSSIGVARHALRTLRAHPRILVLPAVGTIATLLLMSALYLRVVQETAHGGIEQEVQVKATWMLLGPLWWGVYTYTTFFFTAAVVHAYNTVADGGEARPTASLRAAWHLKWKLVPLTLTSAALGWFLRIVERRGGLRRKLLRRAGKLGWSATSMLAVPAIVDDPERGRAIRDAAKLVRKRWGRAAAGTLVAPLVAGSGAFLIALVLTSTLGQAGERAGYASLAVAAAAYVSLRSTLNGMLGAALYRYATRGEVPNGVQPAMLEGMIAPLELTSGEDRERTPRPGDGAQRPQREERTHGRRTLGSVIAKGRL